MNKLRFSALFPGILLVCLSPSAATARDVTLVKPGKVGVTIYSPLEAESPKGEARNHPGRARLRASVSDLALYLGKMSSSQIEIVYGEPPARTKTTPILIGDLGAKRFGPPEEKSRFKQGYRLVISSKVIALFGESDEATSYAIYELLDRLGCRWFMPSDMGEVIPSRETIRMPQMDVSMIPPMVYRKIWYADADYMRRNRLGGVQIHGAHGLENYIPADQLKANLEWNAEINGKRTLNGRYCWGNPEVSDAVADSIIARLDKQYQPSVTLSPGDGITFCGCKKCKALDTNDWDATLSQVSISDRLIHFCNRIAVRVTKKHPDVLFGLYAYVQYTRPPLREKPHPNIVIALAPITYCRAHAITNPDCPSRQSIRPIIEGWSKVAHHLAFRGYLFNLAEVTAPYPMMKQWSEELPIYCASKVKFWMPESMATFDSSLPGLYLNVRLPWHPKDKPSDILDELFERFYGAAAEPMRTYWQTFDDAWSKVPEHAGNVFGHGRRFTPEVMKTARKAINDALAAAKTAKEFHRVKFSDHSLQQFELFMKMRWNLASGKLFSLEADFHRYVGAWEFLRREYGKQYGFGRFHGQYFKRFFGKLYKEGTRVAKEYKLLSGPIPQWRYQVDKQKAGEGLGWSKVDFDDKVWKKTDARVETWSSLGLFDYFGSVWYRAQVRASAVPAGKKVFLWIACTDGHSKLFVNGKYVPFINSKGETVEQFVGFCVPGSFDITAALKPAGENQITIIGTRPPGWINELGTGGLMGPVMLYREK